MRLQRPKNLAVSIPRQVREAICDECDRFDADGVETGGRLIGYCRTTAQGGRIVELAGLIDAGVRASRSNVHLFQDGEYQEGVFRSLEAVSPDLEHVGTWHSHHVNGLDHLSSGDIETYRRTVNHPNQHTDFWYALLVTRKVGGHRRYVMRHFILLRSDDQLYEIDDADVAYPMTPPLWLPGWELPQRPVTATVGRSEHRVPSTPIQPDQPLNLLYPLIARVGEPPPAVARWVGSIELVDRSIAEVLVEAKLFEPSSFEATLGPDTRRRFGAWTSSRVPAPWLALRQAEVHLNRLVFDSVAVRAQSVSPGEEKETVAEADSMQVFTLNVGQGAFTVVRHQGEAVIVDSRIPPNSENVVAFVKRHLSTWLKDHNLRGLLLTGFDADHADATGVGLVVRKYRPEWVAFPDYDKDTLEYKAVREVLDAEVEARADTASPLKLIPVCLDVLNSRPITSWTDAFEFELFSPHPEDMNTSNNCSLVVRIVGKGPSGFSYLATGDTEISRWETISRIFGDRLASDVMAAPHHGSKNAVHPKSLLSISPNTILISAGLNNQFGHPSPNVLRAYQRLAQHVHGTYEHGGASLCTRRVGEDFETIHYVDS